MLKINKIIVSADSVYNANGELSQIVINNAINKHIRDCNRLKQLEQYYYGNSFKPTYFVKNENDSSIYNGEIPYINHAKSIVDMVSNYVFGNPISYENINDLEEHFTLIDEDSHNEDMAIDLGIYGRAYELIYIDNEDYDESESMPYLAILDPLHTFVVYDNTVKQKPLFAVNYIDNCDVEEKVIDYTIWVYTEDTIYEYKTNNLGSSMQLISTEEHYFGGVPIIEYENNKSLQSDFEPILGLIDAYNDLQFNRVVDKQSFLDKLLVLVNSSLGDDESEVSDSIKKIKKTGVLELSSYDGASADAKFINQTFTETDVEILKKAINDDIHKISKCPDMLDENFVGNSSGIAMKYKLLGLEQLGNMKERYFKKGLRTRFRLINNVMNLKNKGLVLADISIRMKRNLPVDKLEQLQILQGTDGILSLRTRLKQYDEEIDVDNEIKQLDEEKKKNMENMSNAFNPYPDNFNEDKPLDKKETKEQSEKEQSEETKKEQSEETKETKDINSKQKDISRIDKDEEVVEK